MGVTSDLSVWTLKNCTGQLFWGSLRLQQFVQPWFQVGIVTPRITAAGKGLVFPWRPFMKSATLSWQTCPLSVRSEICLALDCPTPQLISLIEEIIKEHFFCHLFFSWFATIHCSFHTVVNEEMQKKDGKFWMCYSVQMTFSSILSHFLRQKRVSKDHAKSSFEVTGRTMENNSKISFIFIMNLRSCFTILSFK